MNAFSDLLVIYNIGGDNASNRDIAYRLLINARQIAQLDMAEAAELCHVSPATLSRFVRGMGYDSYLYFKKAMAESIEEQRYFNFMPLSANKRDTDEITSYLSLSQSLLASLAESVDHDALYRFVDTIQSFEHIYFHSLAFSTALHVFTSDLIYNGKHVHYSYTPAGQVVDAMHFGRETLLLAVKYEIRDAVYIDKSIRAAHKAGATVGLIVNSCNSSLAANADFVFPFEGSQHFIDTHFTEIYVSLMATIYQNKYR